MLVPSSASMTRRASRPAGPGELLRALTKKALDPACRTGCKSQLTGAFQPRCELRATALPFTSSSKVSSQVITSRARRMTTPAGSSHVVRKKRSAAGACSGSSAHQIHCAPSRGERCSWTGRSKPIHCAFHSLPGSSSPTLQRATRDQGVARSSWSQTRTFQKQCWCDARGLPRYRMPFVRSEVTRPLSQRSPSSRSSPARVEATSSCQATCARPRASDPSCATSFQLKRGAGVSTPRGSSRLSQRSAVTRSGVEGNRETG